MDFNDEIINIIEQFEYDIYVVNRDAHYKCVCVDYNNGDAIPSCDKCLGTGYKIKIKKIKGVGQWTGIPNAAPSAGRFSDDTSKGRRYYTRAKYNIKEEDIIVDNLEPFIIMSEKMFKSFSGEDVYRLALGYELKNDSHAFIANFRKIVGV